MKEQLLKAINESLLLADILKKERKALEMSDDNKIAEVIKDKESIMVGMATTVKDIFSSGEDLTITHGDLVAKLIRNTKENEKSNKINANIVNGLLATNRKLMSLITGKDEVHVYSKSGKSTTKSNTNIAKA